MEKDDVQLIQHILAGDESAFGDLVQKHQKSVHAVAWREIGDFHFAEEITQDVFLQVYKKLPTLKDSNLFAGWLYVITKRQCIAWKRKNKRSIQSLETMSQQTLDETAYSLYVSEQREDAASEQRQQIVQKLLEKLPEIERTVVILHYLGEMTCEGISKFLGVSPNTVKSRLSRARKRLRNEDTILRETLSSVSLSPNLTQNILRKTRNIEQTSPSGSKPLLPLGALGSSIVLIVFLLGMSNQFLNRYHSSYSLDAQSETTIEIVEVPIITEIKSILDEQNRVGNDTSPGNSSNNSLQKGNKEMQNNLQQDSTKWKLPDGAKARLGKGFVYDLTYSPDGKLLAASGTMGIWIYDADTGEELNLLIGHTDGVSSVAFTPDNKLLASGSKDNSIRVWDPHTGQHKLTFTGHQDEVYSVAFSPDGKTLVSGGADETIRLWDVSTGELRLTFAGHAGGVSTVIYAPDGKTLASHGWDETIRLWDAHTGEFLHSFSGHTGEIRDIAYSPNGKTLASGGDDGTIRLWETHTGHLKTTLTSAIYNEGVKTVLFSPDGQTLISSYWEDDSLENDAIHFWDVASGEHRKTITSPPDTTRHIMFSPDGNTLVHAGSDGTIRFRDAANTTPLRSLTGYAQMFMDMKFSHDGNMLAVVSSDHRLRLWDPHTGKLMNTFYPHPKKISCIACAPDGVTLACGGDTDANDMVWLLNTKTGEHGRSFTGGRGWAESAAFSPDGQTLACGDSNGTIYLWEVSTGKTIKILEWNEGYVRTLTFSADDKMLVSTSDTKIRFWNLNTGEAVKTIPGHTVMLSPNWEKFVSIDFVGKGSKENIQLWRMDSNEPLKTLTSRVETSLRACSPDGRTLVGFDADGKLSFCDAETYEVIRAFPVGHVQYVSYMAYSPDGRTLATSGWDSTILLWDVPQ